VGDPCKAIMSEEELVGKYVSTYITNGVLNIYHLKKHMWLISRIIDIEMIQKSPIFNKDYLSEISFRAGCTSPS
jgi:hypothetical protein